MRKRRKNDREEKKIVNFKRFIFLIAIDGYRYRVQFNLSFTELE